MSLVTGPGSSGSSTDAPLSEVALQSAASEASVTASASASSSTAHGSLRELCALAGHSERVWCVRWSPCGRFLASASGDRTIRVWAAAAEAGEGAAVGRAAPAASWRCIAVLSGAHTRTVRCVAWAPCGRLLASAGFDGRVVVWRRSPPQDQPQAQAQEDHEEWEAACVLEGHENEVKSVAWSLDGELLASCSRDKTVWLWERSGADHSGAAKADAAAAAAPLSFECAAVCSGHSADVKHVAFSALRGRPALLSCGYDNSVRVWCREDDGEEWECTATLEGHRSTVWMAVWAALEQHGRGAEEAEAIISASDDRTIRIWTAALSAEAKEEEKADALRSAQWRCRSVLQSLHTRPIYAVDQAMVDGSVPGHGCGCHPRGHPRHSRCASLTRARISPPFCPVRSVVAHVGWWCPPGATTRCTCTASGRGRSRRWSMWANAGRRTRET